MQTVLDGIPTGPDVDKLWPRFSSLPEGGEVTKQEVAQLLSMSLDKDATRINTVMGALRRRFFRERHIALATVRGVGWKHPTGREQLGMGVSKLRSGVRQIGRGVRVTAAVNNERLPDKIDQGKRDHLVMQFKLMHELGKTTRRNCELRLGKPEVNPR